MTGFETVLLMVPNSVMMEIPIRSDSHVIRQGAQFSKRSDSRRAFMAPHIALKAFSASGHLFIGEDSEQSMDAVIGPPIAIGRPGAVRAVK
jgi:hypothetical protein